ncbi:hypothetical protein [Paenibacillus thiaminolyticus]|uniref:hypothetical protein n=1 Tax=Paenibacillus thiaminolyticus TaxID=49283 RepID=UPI002543CA95|nr:hypothetical protein [Paenibacillus thiaminolyticus]WII37067.1 hypothetical protein O0V01_26180 [Paenibacillus thiaminolyticus]
MTSSERFQLINQTIQKHDLRRVTRYLCQIAEVSTSDYYRWRSAEKARQLRETADQYDFQLIKEHFESSNGKVGVLVIKMRLEKLNCCHEFIKRFVASCVSSGKTRLLLAEAGFKQPMSRKGNCWDNIIFSEQLFVSKIYFSPTLST